MVFDVKHDCTLWVSEGKERRTVIPQPQEAGRRRSKLRNDGIHNLYSWPSIRGRTNEIAAVRRTR